LKPSSPEDSQSSSRITIRSLLTLIPGAFEYVLNYLRRGVFPLAFDRQKGHDYSLYAKIFEEAKYFQCPLLIMRLEDECYYKCVTWQVSTEIQENPMPETCGDSNFNDCLLTSCSKKDD
jgi:BTB/POZ domain-containing protein KCTD9